MTYHAVAVDNPGDGRFVCCCGEERATADGLDAHLEEKWMAVRRLRCACKETPPERIDGWCRICGAVFVWTPQQPRPVALHRRLAEIRSRQR